ncbi:MAG: inorganic diphosphatase [Bdellovibrionales bacterium]|nr:inorganic diphosphatase [Bdellovibrionales bacterium]
MSEDIIEVFVENEKGSNIKHCYDTKSYQIIESRQVSQAYPYPYGFIPNTKSGDGEELDCYVITTKHYATGSTITCKVIGLLEQKEDHMMDHNIIAVPIDETNADPQCLEKISYFIMNVFKHDPSKHIEVGRFLDKNQALKAIKKAKLN